MTDHRPDASTITDDELDALYARAEQAEASRDALFLAAEDVHTELHALIVHGTAPGSAARAAWTDLDAVLGPLRATTDT